MGKKVDLNKPRNTSTTAKTHHNTRPSVTANNNHLPSENNIAGNTKSEVIEAGLRSVGVPGGIAKMASENERVIKSVDNTTGQGIIKFPTKISMVVSVALMVAMPLIALMLFVVLFGGGSSDSTSNGVGFGGYYSSRCDEMTVISVDTKNDYAVTGSETYSMEDYVAGVLYAEIGGDENIEVYKTFAIAARTFALRHASDDCSIEGSARRQAFKDITDRSDEAANKIYEAVKATEGEVLISNGELYAIQYDAFCYTDKNSDHYTLSQQEQQIPVNWAEQNIRSDEYLNCPCNLNDTSMTQCWDSDGNWTDGGHGRGMSQYGAKYLAEEKNYTYDEILEYYYGEDEISINSNSFIASVAGLEIKDTTNASALKEPINTFLNSKGSSLEDLNNFVYESVQENGAGTREGVVTAAVSMINYLYDNFNTKLPYYWGGKVYSGAIPSSFGTYSPSEVSRGGGISYYKSFDCSGFVSWSIRNGGYNFSEQSTTGFDSNYSKNSCNITDSSCVGQPGDLINSRSGHVELIIAVDEANNKYFVAESGGPGVVMQERDMHTGHSSKSVTKILFMEEFYSNPSNVNTNY